MKKNMVFFLIFLSFFLKTGFLMSEEVQTAERIEKVDKDADGIIDEWIYRDAGGVIRRVGKDTNKDGKMDRFMDFLKGRMVVLWEMDRNFDGKVDRRQLDEWGERRLVPGQPTIPGYKMIWREEDNDYDGIIDVYKENKKSNSKNNPVGQPIVGGVEADKIKKIRNQYATS